VGGWKWPKLGWGSNAVGCRSIHWSSDAPPIAPKGRGGLGGWNISLQYEYHPQLTNSEKRRAAGLRHPPGSWGTTDNGNGRNAKGERRKAKAKGGLWSATATRTPCQMPCLISYIPTPHDGGNQISYQVNGRAAVSLAAGSGACAVCARGEYHWI
jgi:hypothetical protein